MKGLLIEVDYKNGRRAAGIDPKDSNLQSYGWQNLPEDDGPDVEIRIAEDGRDLSQYEDKPGVRVLRNDDEIRAAIDRFVPNPDYSLDDVWGKSEDDWGDDLGDGNGLPDDV